MGKQKKDKHHLRGAISTEFNLIKTSETIGGALTHLGIFFAKLQRLPHINCIIASAETELAEEDRIAFENLEKAVAWFHEKIRLLLPHVKWTPDSFAMADVNSLLNFHNISLQSTGYVGSLLFELRHLFLEVAKEEKNHSLFEGWMRTERNIGYSVEVFDWPDYVDKSLNSLPSEQQIYRWKERADTSFSCLLRFLKILSLYPTFIPLTLPARSTVDNLPKNLLELEERQYQAIVGYYLSAFRSPDTAKHPISNAELIKLVDRFLYMLEQKIESDLSDTTTIHQTQMNIVINQFLFFTPSALKEDELTTAMQSPPPTSCQQATPSKQSRWRSDQCDQDVAKFIPYAVKLWKEEIPKYTYPIRIGKERLASKLLENLPSHVSTYSKGKKRFPRALKAIATTDPRIYDDRGNYAGLKPHWENFEWVKI